MPYFYDQVGSGVPGADGASAYQVAVANGFVGSESAWLISLIGPAGASAYEEAVANGFIGTESEWLTSLAGDDGLDGKSAYELAVLAGFIGTEAEWLDSLPGADGADGSSAYEIAVANGFIGTEAEWLASLIGADGADALWNWRGAYDLGASYAVGDVATYNGSSWYRKHANGGNLGDTPFDGSLFWDIVALGGVDGLDGTDGLSAYEVAVANGFVGTEAEWLATLNGANGTNGESAFQIAVSNGFVGTESEWLTSLIGQPGESAYESAVANGFIGTEAEWITSLIGTDGASAYEIAVDHGFVGTEVQWLSSLNGYNGSDGDSAYEVAVTNGFIGNEAQWLASLKGETGDFGGASFDYKFSTNNSIANPGAGYIRLNTTPASATTLVINQVDQNAAVITNYLNTIDDSTSTVKGHFKVVDAANPGNFLYFSISGEHSHLPVPPATPTYFTVPVWYLTGSVASFAEGTDVVITFVRTGDKGDAGLGGTVAAYGVFASTQTQTNPTAGAAMPMTLNVTEAASNVVRTGGDTAIRVLTGGTYNIQFSAQLDKLDPGHDIANIWFRVDGVDVPRSDTEITVIDNNGKFLAAWNIVLDLVANQTVQVMWASADTSMRLYAQSAITTPGAERPAIPSVILTVAQVTYTQVGPTGPQGPAGSVTVGTVTTGAPGTPVTVTNSGTGAAAVLDFVIPQGADGAAGAAGSWASTQVITEITGTSHVLSLANNGALMRFTSGSAVSLTVPAASTANFAIGSHIDLLQYGAGKVTVNGALGVTIRNTPSNYLRNQYSVAALVKIGADEWLLAGDLGVV